MDEARKIILDTLRTSGADWLADSSEETADAVLSALHSAGMKVLPREPTEEMVRRLDAANCFGLGCSDCVSAQDCYNREGARKPDISKYDAWRAAFDAALPATQGGER